MGKAILFLVVLAAIGGAAVYFLVLDKPDGKGGGTIPDTPSVVPLAGHLQVCDSDGEPIRGARVEVFAVNPGRLDARALTELVTDSEGRVVLPGSLGEAENAVVVVSAPDQPTVVTPVANLGGRLEIGTGRTVAGQVVDLHGKPIAGARVTCPGSPPFAAEAVTDEAGRYSLGHLEEDAWIRAEAADHGPLEISLALFPADMEKIVLSLAPGYRVAGRVVDSGDRGVEGAIVRLEQECVSRMRSGPEGAFVMDGVLPDWEPTFTAIAPGALSPSVTAVCGQTDLELPLYATAEIIGTVVHGSTGFPIEDFEIRRHPFERLPRGGFRIRGLCPGLVEVEASAGTLSARVELKLEEGESRQGIRLLLFPPRWAPEETAEPPYPVTIRAVDEATDEPVPNALVRMAETDYEARTDAHGEAIVSLPTGRNRILVGGNLDTHRITENDVRVPEEREAVFRLAPNPILEIDFAGVEVKKGVLGARSAGEEIDLTFGSEPPAFPATPGAPIDLFVALDGYLPAVLEDRRVPVPPRLVVRPEPAAYVTGRCLGMSGHPTPKAGAEIEGLSPQLRMETAGDGLFRVGPVEPGKHLLLINGRNVRSVRMEVDVPPEGIDVGDVTLPAPCRLDIRVVNSAGEPAPGAVVTTTWRVAASGMTDGTGRVELPGTEPSESVRAEADGYLDGWKKVLLPDGVERMNVEIRLFRPARIVLRVVDDTGAPVNVLVPEDTDLTVTRGDETGVLVLTDVEPGAIELTLRDAAGRTAAFRTVVEEGEQRTESVVMK